MILTILTNIFAVFGVVMCCTLIYAYIDTKRKAKKVTKYLEELKELNDNEFNKD